MTPAERLSHWQLGAFLFLILVLLAALGQAVATSDGALWPVPRTFSCPSVMRVAVSPCASQTNTANNQSRWAGPVRSEIRTLASTGRSLMPDGLEASVGPQAMADLVAFLAAPSAKAGK